VNEERRKKIIKKTKLSKRVSEQILLEQKKKLKKHPLQNFMRLSSRSSLHPQPKVQKGTPKVPRQPEPEPPPVQRPEPGPAQVQRSAQQISPKRVRAAQGTPSCPRR
jgi:hypothetical protein